MFSFIKNKIKKIFSRATLDENFLKELEKLLITADTGIKTTKKIIDTLQNDIKSQKITDIQAAQKKLETLLIKQLESCKAQEALPKVLLLVGINGSGKTSFAAKFANLLKKQNKKVLLVAADTFRAAAVEQLNEWAIKMDIPIFIGKPNQDPASVIFDSCAKYKEENFDHIIIDTAGRLQTKVNLMKELEKIKKVIEKTVPEEKIATWLTIDSMLGQNGMNQAKVFHEATNLDGIILTKLDGTGKGGIIFSITKALQRPIVYVTIGETLEDIKAFDAIEYVKNLFE